MGIVRTNRLFSRPLTDGTVETDVGIDANDKLPTTNSKLYYVCFMKEKRTSAATAVKKERSGIGSLFEKTNYTWMLIGAGVMILGFLLMAGGRSDDPNVFNASEVYGTRRITIAPIVILAGLVIEIIAIFRQPKNS